MRVASPLARTCALATLWLVVAVAAAAAADRAGRVDGVEGTADVLHAGAGERASLAAGDAVLLGDRLRTGADGKVRIVLRDESVITLGSGSELTITEQLLAPAPASAFQLLKGTIRALVGDRYSAPGARFEVETPTAVAGVRGTSFIAAYDPAEEETLVVGLEDVTRVRARIDEDGGAEVLVGPGAATRVRRGRRPLTPVPAGEDRVRTLREATELRGGSGAGGRRNALDARRPRRAGEGAFTREERAVDQPLVTPGAAKPPPPPPPVPRGR